MLSLRLEEMNADVDNDADAEAEKSNVLELRDALLLSLILEVKVDDGNALELWLSESTKVEADAATSLDNEV